MNPTEIYKIFCFSNSVQLQKRLFSRKNVLNLTVTHMNTRGIATTPTKS